MIDPDSLVDEFVDLSESLERAESLVAGDDSDAVRRLLDLSPTPGVPDMLQRLAAVVSLAGPDVLASAETVRVPGERLTIHPQSLWADFLGRLKPLADASRTAMAGGSFDESPLVRYATLVVVADNELRAAAAELFDERPNDDDHT